MKLIKFFKMMGLVSIILFSLGLIFFNQLESIALDFIQSYGVVAIIIVVFFAESTPQPIGPEIAFVAGKLAGIGNTGVLVVTLIASAAATLVSYYIGFMFYEDVCHNPKCKAYSLKFKKYGKYFLIGSAILPIPYVPVCWTAGASGYDLKKYFYHTIVPRLLRITVVAFFFRNYLSLIF